MCNDQTKILMKFMVKLTKNLKDFEIQMQYFESEDYNTFSRLLIELPYKLDLYTYNIAIICNL